MPYCSVKWCGKCSKTSSLTKDDITFHRFPKCPKLKEKWINATQRDGNWFPGKNHVICSRHFTKDCFRYISGNRRFLFETAVPTLMLPCLSTVQNILDMPSTYAESETVNRDILTPPPQKNTNVDISLSIPHKYSTPIKRRLYRAVIDLSQKVKKKNVAIKRLRDTNRMLKRKVHSLKRLLGELEQNNN